MKFSISLPAASSAALLWASVASGAAATSRHEALHHQRRGTALSSCTEKPHSSIAGMTVRVCSMEAPSTTRRQETSPSEPETKPVDFKLIKGSYDIKIDEDIKNMLVDGLAESMTQEPDHVPFVVSTRIEGSRTSLGVFVGSKVSVPSIGPVLREFGKADLSTYSSYVAEYCGENISNEHTIGMIIDAWDENDTDLQNWAMQQCMVPLDEEEPWAGVEVTFLPG